MATIRGISSPRTTERDYNMLAYEDVMSQIVDRAEYELAQVQSWEQSQVMVAQAAIASPEDVVEEDRRIRETVTRVMFALAVWHKRRFTTSAKRRFGIDRLNYLDDFDVNRAMQQRIRANIDLIKTIPQRFHDDLYRDIIRLQAESPFNEQLLRRTLEGNYDSSGHNARRITRDQTQKAVAELNQIRQGQIGITQYQWLTSQDERVRATHAANSGRVFRWDSPPVLTGHPGNDIQCRCVALGIIPGTEPAFDADGEASFI